MFGKGVPVREVFYFDLQRRVTAHKTMEAWDNIPHAGLIIDLDVTDVLALTQSLKTNPEFAEAPLSINSVMLKIIAEGLKESPLLNAYVTYKKRSDVGQVTVFDDINIAMPVLLEDGRTITPVLHQVGAKSLREVGRAMADLRRRIANTNVDFLLLEAGKRDTIRRVLRGDPAVAWRIWANFFGKGRLRLPPDAAFKAYERIPESDRVTPEDLLSATILVSNIGSAMPELRAHVALLEIIPPQSAAIGLGAVRKAPLVKTNADGIDEVVVRVCMPMSLYFDHRSIDFFHIMGFLKRVLALCEKPGALLSL
ncbi:MAG TPA: 2-oxo acid dehydrogenase subunit E2 [Candidatus Hydrogenedentes bacterium]|nr:2-oxo acid dehydrogenase subunit E2 [Candidatus Hydrogenedentota bacterium]HPG70254.1 2-oxo acid dehydrogenase subunit E2 [Candidatus Hydrogenedentota bacterium]